MAMQNLYHELVKHPAMAAQLTDYQKDKLRHYAEDEALKATRTIVDMMDGTPNYPYPEEYRNGREVEYLLSKHSPAYWDSQQVLRLLNAPPARPLDTPAPVATSGQPKAKSPVSDILYYFPAVAATLGNAPTDESALTGLAVWLGHRYERNNRFPNVPRCTLRGQIQEQQAASSDTDGFLKACLRLHKAITRRLAAEHSAKELLGSVFSSEKWQVMREAATWWAGWIKEQGHPLVRQYLDALKTIPVFQNVQHQWDLDARVCDDSIEVELNPLAREFKYVYVEMKSARQKVVLLDLLSIAKFDTNRIAQYRAQHEQGDYQLEWLIANLKEFHFKAWDGRYPKNNLVTPNFWGFLQACVSIRQGQAKAILIALGEATFAPPITTAQLGASTEEATPPTAIPVDFSLYIKEEYREKLIPFLKQKYTGQKSQAVACMILALHDLTALKNSPHENKTKLHNSLRAFFGEVGTRQSLSTNLKNLEYAKGNEHLQIEAHRDAILDFMK
jgi:hypothetical protein